MLSLNEAKRVLNCLEKTIKEEKTLYVKLIMCSTPTVKKYAYKKVWQEPSTIYKNTTGSENKQGGWREKTKVIQFVYPMHYEGQEKVA